MEWAIIAEWVSIGTGAHLLASGTATWHLLRRPRESSVAVLWLLILWLFPAIGVAAYLCFGINRVPAQAWRRRNARETFLESRTDAERPAVYWKALPPAVAADRIPEIARAVSRSLDSLIPDYPLLGGNQFDLLRCGDEAYPAMLEAIAGARHHVHLQSFILANDSVGREFLSALLERARAGVEVRILYDRFGSTHAVVSGFLRPWRRRDPRMRLGGWSQASLLRRQFQLHLRNHRKTMIVDGTTAFTGGINLGEANRSAPGRPALRDLHFRARGPVVRELQHAFLSDWFFMTGEPPERLLCAGHFPPAPDGAGAAARIIPGGPDRAQDLIADSLFACIRVARRQVLAITPYLIPPRDLLRALRIAALEGIEVRLVVPRVNNHWYAGYAGAALYDELLEAGVRIHERRPPFLHTKALVVDDELTVVGTANLDTRSLSLNYETNLLVADAGFAGRVKQQIWEELGASRELTLETWRKRPAARRVLENACNLLAPVL
jgi:cardiolipin synthase